MGRRVGRLVCVHSCVIRDNENTRGMFASRAQLFKPNSGPQAKFGQQRYYIWPAREYKITTIAGPLVLCST